MKCTICQSHTDTAQIIPSLIMHGSDMWSENKYICMPCTKKNQKYLNDELEKVIKQKSTIRLPLFPYGKY